MENTRIDFDRQDFDGRPMCGCGDGRGPGFDGFAPAEFFDDGSGGGFDPAYRFADFPYGGGFADGAGFPFFPAPEFAEYFEDGREHVERPGRARRRDPDPGPDPDCCREPERAPNPGCDDIEQLRRFMDDELAAATNYRRLACRLPRCASNALLRIEADKRRRLKRLCAMYYLLTCCKYSPRCPEKCCISTCELLRSVYEDEFASEKAYLDAAGMTRRDDLAELYRDLAPEAGGHAKKIARLVEQLYCCEGR